MAFRWRVADRRHWQEPYLWVLGTAGIYVRLMRRTPNTDGREPQAVFLVEVFVEYALSAWRTYRDKRMSETTAKRRALAFFVRYLPRLREKLRLVSKKLPLTRKRETP